jgi:hypothetical protein
MFSTLPVIHREMGEEEKKKKEESELKRKPLIVCFYDQQRGCVTGISWKHMYKPLLCQSSFLLFGLTLYKTNLVRRLSCSEKIFVSQVRKDIFVEKKTNNLKEY